MACVCQAEIAEYGDEILRVLDRVRSDKNQPVRTAAQETIKRIREVVAQEAEAAQSSSSNSDVSPGRPSVKEPLPV